MKIRTDFVTNSSSYCTTEVIIDNPVLLEILQKYKDMGLLGGNNSIIGIGDYESMDEWFYADNYHDRTKTPAFFYYEEQSDENIRCLFLVSNVYPKYLDEVLENIILIIDIAGKYLDGQLLPMLKEELSQRKDEINRAYAGVYWRSSTSGDGGDVYARLEYDPIKGESYSQRDPNSIEFNTTEVIIDNPVLLEILQKYREMGLLGDNDSIIGIGDYKSMDEQFDADSYQDRTKNPAFFYYEKQNAEGLKSLNLIDDSCDYPRNLDKVLDCVVQILDSAFRYLDRQMLPMLQKELYQRKDEIDSAYKSVYWYWKPYNDWDQYEKFEYDPINGESFSEGPYSFS